MTPEELERAEKNPKGKYDKRTGALQYISVWSRDDISHTVMRLSGCNAAPALLCWKALDHLMIYLFHKPHVQIMFSRNKVKEREISAHHEKGEAESTDLKNIREHTGLKTYTQGDLNTHR